MPNSITVPVFLELQRSSTVIDVRSPSEFGEGHIPGSHNIPLLDDEQRKKVGIQYKKGGKLEAIELGFDLTGPELGDKIRKVKSIIGDKRALIYCWRGGMRSSNMAWLLETNGFDCSILEGGYKSFRNYGKSLFERVYLSYVIGGYTGSNKTRILHALRSRGEQVLDIEGIANHRGSSFGMIGQEAQLTNEQFENQLIWEWLAFNQHERIWVEDESKILGSNHIPEPLFKRIRNSMVFKLEIDRVQRAKNLVEIYGPLETDQLEKAIKRIEKKLGHQKMELAIQALRAADFQTVAEISLSYYDKTYSFGISKRDPVKIIPLKPSSNNPDEIAAQLIKLAEKLEKR